VVAPAPAAALLRQTVGAGVAPFNLGFASVEGFLRRGIDSDLRTWSYDEGTWDTGGLWKCGPCPRGCGQAMDGRTRPQLAHSP
jgi:hypothetical protein